jgi:putative ABC transport system permease protein
MKWLKQLIEVSVVSLASLPRRVGTAGVAVLGIAGVVGVFVAVMALATSLEDSLLKTGSADRFLVVRGGANFESSSFIPRDAIDVVARQPGVRKAPDGAPLLSADAVVSVGLPGPGGRENVTARGASAQVWSVRPELRVIEGRAFQPGLREIVIGRTVRARFPDLRIGSEVPLQGGGWRIVGVFESGGDTHESEMLTDLETLLSAYQRSSLSSITGQLTSAAAFAELQHALSSDPTVSVDVLRESDFYRRSTEGVARFLFLSGRVITIIMALGAVFAALSAMYATTEDRSGEIATLRALGFQSSSVVGAVLIESLLLAAIGAALGALVAWLVFNGSVVSTVASGSSDSQILVPMLITPGVLTGGILWALGIGFLGGAAPALRAGTRPIARLLQQLR